MGNIRSSPNETFTMPQALPEKVMPVLQTFVNEVDAARAAPLFITSGAVWTASDVLAGEATGKHLSTGYDAANSTAYIRSVNSGTAFTDLHLAGLKTSLWSASGSGDVVETLRATAGRVELGFGDRQSVYVAAVGQLLDLARGTAAAPDTISQPTLKVSRLIQLTNVAVTGDGREQASGISSIVVGNATNEVQPLAFNGSAISNGAYDAGGGIFEGSARAAGGVGIGLAAYGRKEVAGALATGIEVAAGNFSGVDDDYDSGGFQVSQSIWIFPGGTNRVSAGMVFGNPSSNKFDVGIGFTSQNGGAIRTSTFRDDSSSINSLHILGTHTYALIAGPTAGKIGLGTFTPGEKVTVVGLGATSATASFSVYNSALASLIYVRDDGHVGVGTATPGERVTIVGLGSTGATASLNVLNASLAALFTINDDGSVIAPFSITTPILTAAANLTAAPVGDFIFNPTGNDVRPEVNYDLNFGALDKKWLTIHGAELWVETLVAQNTIATIGGRILVGPTTSLTSDLLAADTSIAVKHNQMVSGDRVYLEANGKVEFIAITSGPSGAGPYTYTVTRDLDGSGANDWFAGDAVFNTGQTGSGFIDIYSVRGVKAGTELGPTIAGNTRNSATFNDWSTAWAIGNLDGKYGYSGATMGVAFGKYIAGTPHITIDSTNGYRVFSGLSTVIGQWDASANFKLGPDVSAAATTKFFISNASQTYNAEAGFVAGDLLIGDNTVASNLGNLKLTAAGAIKIRRGVTDYITIDATSMELTNILNLKGASSAFAVGTLPPLSASVGSGYWQDRTGMYWITGVAQVEEATVTGTITLSGNATVVVTSARLPGGAQTYQVPVLVSDTADVVENKIRAFLNADSVFAIHFTAAEDLAFLNRFRVTAKHAAADDATFNISVDNGTCTGLTATPTSTVITAGSHTTQSSFDTATGGYMGGSGVITINSSGLSVLGAATKTLANTIKLYNADGSVVLGSLYALTAGVGGVHLTAEDGQVLKFQTLTSGSVTNRMELHSVGMVIGVSATPGAMLDVRGSAIFASTAPSIQIVDTTGSAKSLTIAVDANLANLRESAGASGSLFILDLANNRAAVGTASPLAQFQIGAMAEANPATFQGVLKVVGSTQTVVGSVGGIELPVANNYGYKIQALSDSGAALAFAVRNGSATWTEVARFNPSANLKIAGIAVRGTTEGSNHLDIFDGTSPAGTLANGCSVYSRAGELYAMDAAGNETIQSPHDKQTGEWIFWSKNTVTGRVLRVDMERLMKAVDAKLGGGFIQEYTETVG